MISSSNSPRRLRAPFLYSIARSAICVEDLGLDVELDAFAREEVAELVVDRVRRLGHDPDQHLAW